LNGNDACIPLSFSVRLARASDADNIQALLVETWHAAYDPILSVDEVARHCAKLFDRASILHYLRDDGLNRFFVSESGNRLCGVAQCAIGPKGVATVYMLYVRPEFQRQGVGASLMTHCAGAFPWANGLGIEVLAPNRPAIAFYEKFGFQSRGEFLQPARASVPIAHMRRELSEGLSE